MLLERVILPSKAVTGQRLVVHYVSRHIIFHDLIPTNKSKGKGILRHKRRAQGSCLNSCVAWAITLTERRSARFAFSGTLMPFPSITRNPTGGATVEHLPLINCSSWACTQDFDALREVREPPFGSHSLGRTRGHPHLGRLPSGQRQDRAIVGDFQGPTGQ